MFCDDLKSPLSAQEKWRKHFQSGASAQIQISRSMHFEQNVGWVHILQGCNWASLNSFLQHPPHEIQKENDLKLNALKMPWDRPSCHNRSNLMRGSGNEKMVQPICVCRCRSRMWPGWVQTKQTWIWSESQSLACISKGKGELQTDSETPFGFCAPKSPWLESDGRRLHLAVGEVFFVKERERGGEREEDREREKKEREREREKKMCRVLEHNSENSLPISEA